MGQPEQPEQEEKRGRPSKLTDERRAVICDCIRRGCSIANGAEVGGVERRTIEHWLERGEKEPDSDYGEFRAEVLKARADAEAMLVGIIERAAKLGSWKAACWLLERGFAEDWTAPAKPLGRPAKRGKKTLGEEIGRMALREAA